MELASRLFHNKLDKDLEEEEEEEEEDISVRS